MNRKFENEQQDLLLTQYMDGELPKAERSELEKALASDPALTDRLRQYREVDQALERVDELPFDDDDFDNQRGNVMAVLERRMLLDHSPRKHIRLTGRRIKVAAVAAVIAVLAVVGSLVLPWNEPQPDPSEVLASLVEPSRTSPNAELDVSMATPSLEMIRLAPPEMADRDVVVPPGTVVVTIGDTSADKGNGSDMPFIVE
ncbi:MAG: anti-sigma factor family protein [Phycisphaerae bacterium]